jgi:hypothetical protein
VERREARGTGSAGLEANFVVAAAVRALVTLVRQSVQVPKTSKRRTLGGCVVNVTGLEGGVIEAVSVSVGA